MRTLTLALAAGLLLPLLAASCSSTGGSDGPRRSMNVIELEEMDGQNFRSAHDAVLRLRPQWLQGRGTVNASGQSNLPVVFLDNSRYGSIQQLHIIQIADVQSLRFLSASDATTRYGTGYPGGIIQVISRGR